MEIAKSNEKWLVALFVAAPFAASAQPVRPTVEIAREYKGIDCVAGVLTVEKSVVAYLVAAPYKHDKPRLGKLSLGTFDAELRGDERKGWDATFIPNPNVPVVKLHLGNRAYRAEGGVAMGDNPSSTCQFPKRSEYARAARSFDLHLKPFRSSPTGPLPIRLRIDDR